MEAAFPTNQTKGIPPQKNNNFATMIPAFTSSSNAAVLSTIDTKDSDKQDTTVPASYALPPNYFDRNAKPIIVSRKEKNYSQSVIYKTKVYSLLTDLRSCCSPCLKLLTIVVFYQYRQSRKLKL